MSNVNLDALGLPIIEMRCIECSGTQYLKLRQSEPFLTRCHHCKTFLVVRLLIKEKPNNVLLTLDIASVSITENQTLEAPKALPKGPTLTELCRPEDTSQHTGTRYGDL